MTDAASNKNLAGPLVFEPSVVELDASIRDDNDALRIDEKEVYEFVVANRDKIFGIQAEFFADLRKRTPPA